MKEAGNRPFVGPDRIEVLLRLLADWDEVSRIGKPRAVCISAPLGWGKTRIIQEFYERIAVQDGSHYWPDLLQPRSEGVDISIIAHERKKIRPDGHGDTGKAPHVWLTLQFQFADGYASLRPYVELQAQLLPQVASFLRKARIKKAGTKAALGTMATFLPIPSDVSKVLDIANSFKDLSSELTTHGKPGAKSARTQYAPDTSAEDFWKIISTVWREGDRHRPSIVLAIEDAHLMSEEGVLLVRSLLSSSLPILVVAAGWPVRTDDDDPNTRSYAELLAGAPPGLRIEHLTELQARDIQTLVEKWHPGTPFATSLLLSQRTGCNPYALRLALIRLGGVRGLPLHIEEEKIRRMPFDINQQFEQLLWAMNDSTRLGLAASAIIGPRSPRDVLAASLSMPEFGNLEAATRSDWLRADPLQKDTLAFLEPLRYEVARSHGRAVFSQVELSMILISGLQVLRKMLRAGNQFPEISLLHELHIAMAEEGVEVDAGEAFKSGVSLSSFLRDTRQRHQLRALIDRLDRLAERMPLARETRAEYAVERAFALAFAERRTDSNAISALTEALEIVSTLPVERPDLRCWAFSKKASLHIPEDPPGLQDLVIAREYFEKARAVSLRIDTIEERLLHYLRSCEYRLTYHEGNQRRALKLALHEYQRARLVEHGGNQNSLAALEDAAWFAMRCEQVPVGVALTRELLIRQEQYWSSSSHPLVAVTAKDLALRIVRMNSSDLIPEAYSLAKRAHEDLIAAYGENESPSIVASSVLGYVMLRYGLTLGSNRRRTSLVFQNAVTMLEHTLALKKERWSNPPMRILQERLAFGRALQGEPRALSDLNEFLDRRRTRDRGSARSETRWLAEDLVLALRELNRFLDADRISKLYMLDM